MNIEEITADLHTEVQRTATETHCPSIAWAVAHHGQITHHGFARGADVARDPDVARGVDVARGADVASGAGFARGADVASGADGVDGAGDEFDGDERTRVYRIASMTKSFTAATVLALCDDGLLHLDDPIASLAPEFAAIRHPAPDAPEITVRHLLSMTAGLATDDAWADRHLDFTDADLDNVYTRGATFAVKTGTEFEYSNLGYAMLGRIIHRVTGQRPQEVTSERVLRPLALLNTTWTPPTDTPWAPAFRVQDGVNLPEPPPLGDGGLAPMGGLWSNLNDLATWTNWLSEAFSGGGEDATIVRRASRRQMQTTQTYRFLDHRPASGPEAASVAISEGYGFGLCVDHDDRHGLVIHHTGGLPGYGSNMRWLPARGLAIIALANVTYARMEALTMRLLDRLGDLGAIPDAPSPEWPELERAGRGLVELLNGWTDSRANKLFADNVELDESFERRAAAARRLVDLHGSLQYSAVRASWATSGVVVAQGTNGSTVEIDVELTPQVPPLVQLYATRT